MPLTSTIYIQRNLVTDASCLIKISVAVNCWPSVSGNDTYVNIEYEASYMFDLQNVVIFIPLTIIREAPAVTQIVRE